MDVSKVPHYAEPDGLEHWFDARTGVIRTNDESIYLSFHSYYAKGYIGFSYANLYFDGGFATITQEDMIPDRISFSPDFQERTDSGEQIWHVDHIFREFVLPDSESYPWVPREFDLPRITVRGMNHFEYHDQQEKFIRLINALLSRHDGVPNRALAGKEAKGNMVFGDGPLRSFETGELIR